MGSMRGLAFAVAAQSPAFRFITVDETRLRYLDSGAGTPVVLLHGNGSMIEDFVSSGIWTCARLPLHRLRPAGFRIQRAAARPHLGPVGAGKPHAPRSHATRDRPSNRRRPLLGDAGGAGHGARKPRGRGWPGAPLGVLLSDSRAEIAVPAGAFPFTRVVLHHTVVPFVRRLMAPDTLRRVFAPCEGSRAVQA